MPGLGVRLKNYLTWFIIQGFVGFWEEFVSSVVWFIPVCNPVILFSLLLLRIGVASWSPLFYRLSSFSLSNTQSRTGDSWTQADWQHLCRKLLTVFGVTKMALAISRCGLEAPPVILCDWLVQGIVGRGSLSCAHRMEGQTLLAPCSTHPCTFPMQWC